MKNLSIIGIGKLGLCFALTLEKAGYNVLGVDINSDYVNSVNDKSYITTEPDVNEHLAFSKNFMATTSIEEAVRHSDIIFTIVATPTMPDGRYGNEQINTVVSEIEKLGKQETRKHFVVCCTVMPGYCDSIRERLDKLNYSVSYNPEFIAQGTILKNQASPDMVLIGEATKEVGDLIQEIYEAHTVNTPVIARMTPLEAEITKIGLNCFLTTKIAYANMIGDIVKEVGGNPEVVLSAIGSDSRVGNKFLRYGYGFGGDCLPRDGRALSIFAKDINMPSEISNAADLSNKLHAKEQLKFFIKENPDKTKEVIFSSVSFKPESTNINESQQLLLAVELAKAGYKVLLKERQEVIAQVYKKYKDLFTYEVRN